MVAAGSCPISLFRPTLQETLPTSLKSCKGLVYQYAFDYADKHRAELSKLKTGAEFSDLFTKTGHLWRVLRYAVKNGVANNETGIKLRARLLRPN